uniref:Helicase ATP-binding domain-containing protein n=1 Tax=Manihot esculenta TaxID=3983 RepID=A0A2C9TZF8_MANES
MVSATPESNKPNPKTENVYHIGGIKVEFPYQPYGTQLAFMGRVISTLDRAQKDGHCHALLESPTGTGKSLSLLCSTLAWQQNYTSKQQQANQSHQKPNPEAMSDPLAHGGGFIPETQPSSIPPSGNAEPPQSVAVNKSQKKKVAPTIFYSSRTHSQISQVIREYRKTAYRVPMAVLASRKHYCTNAHVRGGENIDEECKLLLKDPDAGCSQFKNANKVKAHPSLQSGGCHEVHDIEDLVKVGKVVKGCSYYAARSMADDAHWSGDKALRELEEANISQQCFPILLDCATKAIKAATDAESDTDHLSGMSVIVLEGLFCSLTYFFSRNGCHTSDYQLALQRSIKRDRKNPVGDWKHTLSLWCLNPAVVFGDIANISLSVILTSGTLSPMNSFSSELGVQFGTCLEAPHVVDTESQVWAAVISTGPDNYPLNASYRTADEFAFQDALGKTLEDIFMVVPAGSLVFFPSYKLMEKLCNRWRETGQWSRLNVEKSLFVEPRRGSQEDDFDSVLTGYYDSIHQRTKHTVGKKRKIKKIDQNHLKAAEPTENSQKGGAAFLAVCRGKVSEGIDFSDDNARVVILNFKTLNIQIVVGIPFPNIHDIQVSLKKNYNDIYKTSKKLLSGNDWYCHQAFRALNQAAGTLMIGVNFSVSCAKTYMHAHTR